MIVCMNMRDLFYFCKDRLVSGWQTEGTHFLHKSTGNSVYMHDSRDASNNRNTKNHRPVHTEHKAMIKRCHPDLNRGIKVLQTFALPLGDGTK